jgi:hypothetical protein
MNKNKSIKYRVEIGIRIYDSSSTADGVGITTAAELADWGLCSTPVFSGAADRAAAKALRAAGVRGFSGLTLPTRLGGTDAVCGIYEATARDRDGYVLGRAVFQVLEAGR